MYGTFIGRDGSMGFKHGKSYGFITYCKNDVLILRTIEGLYCPYSNLEKLLENWRIQILEYIE